MSQEAIAALATIGLIAIACQWFAWWVKLPAILFLLLAGIAAGPLLGWLDPDVLFGELLFPFISLSVAVILFEGGLTLKLKEIVGLEGVVRRLVTTGIVITGSIVTVATHILLGFSWGLALLFGALTVVTGPTVIVPMLRTVRPTAHIANILRWEGIVIDPIGALLAVIVFEFIASGRGGAALGHTFLTFGATLAAGTVLGAAAGQGLGIVLRRYWLPEYLHNVATLTVVFAVFAAANRIQAESGLLAVTVMGLWLGNMKNVPTEDILDFKESLSLLLISGLFILLAARVDLEQVRALGWGALGVLVVMQFVARPAKVLASTWGSSLSWRERALLSWVAPRGIVAAAVAAVFAIRLQTHGYEQASLLVPLTFLVIIGTVVVQSATARGIARWLGVAEPEPSGFLIIGANPVARSIAKELQDHGFNTLLTDTNWDHVRAALMDGLQAYYGNAVSEHADRQLDLVGIGRLLAMSPQRDVNVLAAMRYRTEFGAQNIYTVQSTLNEEDQTRSAHPPVGHVAFGSDVSFAKLSSLISQGAEIHATPLTETFDYDAYYKQYYRRAIVLFGIDPRGRLHVATQEGPEPTEGWTVISMIQKPKEEAEQVPAESGQVPKP